MFSSVCFRYLLKEPVINDDLPSRILYGAIKVKSRVKELTETSAIFEDGTVEENIDIIVFATGYTFSFPFLEDLVKVENNMVSLYKFIFPPQLEKSTLACLGLIQPLGPIFPAIELQARWVTRVFKGKWVSEQPGEWLRVSHLVDFAKNKFRKGSCQKGFQPWLLSQNWHPKKLAENSKNNKYWDTRINIHNHSFKILENSENFNWHSVRHILLFVGLMKEQWRRKTSMTPSFTYKMFISSLGYVQIRRSRAYSILNSKLTLNI